MELPISLYEGEDHSEDPGMRPAQFSLLLDKILFDRLLRNPSERRCERREDQSDGLGFPIRKE
jgi:hypothetical protein